MRCDKFGYKTRKEAKAAKRAHNSAFQHGKCDKKATNIYTCTNCGLFHLTTMKRTRLPKVDVVWGDINELLNYDYENDNLFDE